MLNAISSDFQIERAFLVQELERQYEEMLQLQREVPLMRSRLQVPRAINLGSGIFQFFAPIWIKQLVNIFQYMAIQPIIEPITRRWEGAPLEGKRRCWRWLSSGRPLQQFAPNEQINKSVAFYWLGQKNPNTYDILIAHFSHKIRRSCLENHPFCCFNYWLWLVQNTNCHEDELIRVRDEIEYLQSLQAIIDSPGRYNCSRNSQHVQRHVLMIEPDYQTDWTN